MNKEKGRLEQLYTWSMNNEASTAQREEMAELMLLPEHKALADALLLQAYSEPKDFTDVSSQTREAILQAIFAANRPVAEPAAGSRPVVQLVPERFTFKFWMAAAVVIIIAGLAVVLNISRFNGGGGNYNGIDAQNDIAAGKNGATLTLADGRKISLSDAVNGQVASEAGVEITKTKDGRVIYAVTPGKQSPQSASGVEVAYNTLSTAKGQMYQVVLPDQSVVWLNAASSLKYPASFAAVKERKVELEGEAYFEISKMAIDHSARGMQVRIPFIVMTKSQRVEVLGTHFNINSYADEPATKTTLLEGSVRVQPSAGHTSPDREGLVLKPGEQSVLKGRNIQMNKVDTESALAWKKGDFIFSPDDDLRSAMRKIARWYDVEIIYDASAPMDMEPRGWISRKNKLSAVLSRIESTGKIHFKIEGRRVTVMR